MRRKGDAGWRAARGRAVRAPSRHYARSLTLCYCHANGCGTPYLGVPRWPTSGWPTSKLRETEDRRTDRQTDRQTDKVLPQQN